VDNDDTRIYKLPDLSEIVPIRKILVNDFLVLSISRQVYREAVSTLFSGNTWLMSRYLNVHCQRCDIAIVINGPRHMVAVLSRHARRFRTVVEELLFDIEASVGKLEMMFKDMRWKYVTAKDICISLNNLRIGHGLQSPTYNFAFNTCRSSTGPS
jgi:hypothetical protein